MQYLWTEAQNRVSSLSLPASGRFEEWETPSPEPQPQPSPSQRRRGRFPWVLNESLCRFVKWILLNLILPEKDFSTNQQRQLTNVKISCWR